MAYQKPVPKVAKLAHIAESKACDAQHIREVPS